jgi:hypothetical protein
MVHEIGRIVKCYLKSGDSNSSIRTSRRTSSTAVSLMERRVAMLAIVTLARNRVITLLKLSLLICFSYSSSISILLLSLDTVGLSSGSCCGFTTGGGGSSADNNTMTTPNRMRNISQMITMNQVILEVLRPLS